MTIIRKHPAFFLVGSMTSPLAGILLLPFLWQKLTPADYGVLATAELIMAFGAAFIGLQQESSLNRLYFDWKDSEKNKNISTLLTLNLATIIIFGSVLLFLFEYLGGPALPEETLKSSDLIILFLGYLILTKQRSILNAYLRVTGRSLEFLLYHLIALFIQIAFVVQYVFIDNLKLSGYIMALLTSESLVAISAIFFIYAKTGVYFDFPIVRSSLKFSVPLIPAAIFSSGSIIVERSLLLAYVPLSDMGIYAVCQKVASVIQLANNSLKILFAPKAFEMVSDNVDRSLLSKHRNKYFLFIILFSSFILPSMAILTYFSGAEEYQKAAPLFPFFVLISLCVSAYPYFCSGPYFSKNTYLSSYPPLIDLLFFSFSAIFFGGIFQLGGIILAKLVATLLFISSGYILSQRSFNIPFIPDKKITISTLFFLAILVTFSFFSKQ
jgi:O-antigen/teichoic acid export membrane protein